MAALEHQLRQVWQQASEQFIADGGPLLRVPAEAAADTQASWSRCLAGLEDVFTHCFGAAAVQRRFAVPDDYATFMQTIGGGWRWPYRLEWCLFDAATVAKATRSDVELWLSEEQHEHAPNNTGLWLRIGSWSDKHDYLVCCDREQADFGCILHAHDTNPWGGGAEVGCHQVANSFLAWLESLAKRR